MLKISRIKLGHLYAKGESYWAQRSRIRWLKEHNRSTHFFHVWATSRLKKNKIEGLEDSNGIWMRDTYNIYRVAWDYFHNLFKPEASNHDDNYLNYIQRCVIQNVNNMLTRKIMDDEILEAFNQMDPCKALDDNKGISSLSDMMIILMSKIKDPIDMTKFQLISLFRVIYKIISKVLANRLKSLKNSPNKGFFIKLDMRKAYDHIEWNFLKNVMKKMGFDGSWIEKSHTLCSAGEGYFRGHKIKNMSNMVGMQREMERKAVEDFIMTLWNNWNNRKNFVFHGKEDEARVIWDSARMLCYDF
ncbi:hypothetical protein J1N35_005441 [Gossypium stocksii]|uniref:Reverse transcriptase domain-containing protein n=1 Tax=Gossypium stocksii TaxID=47602 RepID=A0A9D3WEA8_9ROSI|nr:hypothetical protein J1N35_005441 [Gossypium stocksii]